MTRLSSSSTDQGFTLVEVLVALTILSMSFAVLFSLASRSLDGMSRARDVERRIEFAQTKLSEISLLSELEPGDKASGALDDGTRWLIEILPFVEPVTEGVLRNQSSVVRIRVSLEWQGRREPQTWMVESYRYVTPPQTPALRVSLEDQLRAIASR